MENKFIVMSEKMCKFVTIRQYRVTLVYGMRNLE